MSYGQLDIGAVAARSLAEHRSPEPGEREGWQAELALDFARADERTVLARRRQAGPLTVQRAFYPEPNGVCHTYLLHPPAGIVGGDRLAMSFDIGAGADVLLTTPAATRWYFSRAREAQLSQRAQVAAGATLEWLPQETLLFDGAHARLLTRIDLAEGAGFCGWEVLGFGRPACNEKFTGGRVDFRFEIWRAGRPLLLDRLRSAGGRIPGMRDFAACATLVATAASRALLERARQALHDANGALVAVTLIGDLLIARGLAAQCEPLVAIFSELWSTLRPELLGRAAVPPRIWRT